MTPVLRRLVATGAFLCAAPSLPAQEQPDQLRVFIDCSYYCDMDFLRTELTWIDHMRDRADAHVHVLVTRQQTGGGGSEFTLSFIGLRHFDGRADTLRYVASADNTSDVTRRGLAHTIKLGLVPYVATTPLAHRLQISVAPAGEAADAAQAGTAGQDDPWNFWSFRIGMNGNASGESQQRFSYFSGNLTANRTTEAWKVNLGLNGNYNESTFEYEIDGVPKKTVSIRRGYSGNGLLVKSLGSHVSAGLRTSASTSTFGNTSLSFSIAPAVEYNFVPYSESTRRQFTVRYSTGVRYADYREITIFDQLEETRPTHTLQVNYFTRQPWGSINVGLDASQYLHDTKKYNAGFGGSTEVRLFKGFSFNIGGNYSHIRDQIALAARDLTEEEILLRQRQLATGYEYWVFFGIGYRFGSIFNNVVNPRFGGGGDGMIIMM